MTSDNINHVFQCPSCGSRLKWMELSCSACHFSFRIDDGIIDFIDEANVIKQHKIEMDLHKTLADEYDRRYGDAFSKLFSQYWNELFLSHLRPHSEFVLDCGCGTGELAADLLPKASNVIGCDISKDMMRQARKKTAQWMDITWVSCLGEKLPFVDGLFDAVCYRGALHHMASEKKALEEACRVLRKGGTMMLSEPNDDSLLLRFPRRIANKKMNRFGNNHKAFKSAPLMKMISSLGFFIKHTQYFSYLTEPLCGMSDLLPIMKFSREPVKTARRLIRIDNALSKIPFIRKQSFEFFLVATKI